MGAKDVCKQETAGWRGAGFDRRTLKVRVRSEGLHLGTASAAPKAGVRRSLKDAMIGIVSSTVQRAKQTVDAPESDAAYGCSMRGGVTAD